MPTEPQTGPVNWLFTNWQAGGEGWLLSREGISRNIGKIRFPTEYQALQHVLTEAILRGSPYHQHALAVLARINLKEWLSALDLFERRFPGKMTEAVAGAELPVPMDTPLNDIPHSLQLTFVGDSANIGVMCSSHAMTLIDSDDTGLVGSHFAYLMSALSGTVLRVAVTADGKLLYTGKLRSGQPSKRDENISSITDAIAAHLHEIIPTLGSEREWEEAWDAHPRSIARDAMNNMRDLLHSHRARIAGWRDE